MPFGKGSSGAGVQLLQTELASWIEGANKEAAAGLCQPTGLVGLFADGDFGDNTEVALATFQRDRKLSPTGYADADTLRELGLRSTLNEEGTDAQVIDSTVGGA